MVSMADTTLEEHLFGQAAIVLSELRAARELATSLGRDPKLVTPHYLQMLRCLYLDEPLGKTTPPAEGEVGELVELLHKEAAEDEIGAHMLWMTPADARRAAELLQQQHPTPVPVSEGLPEPNTKVLAHYFNALGNGRTICAIWVPAKSRSEGYGDDDFTEYDEENDTYYWPEGWYEAIENWDDLGWVAVNEGEVAYWQPLPKWPALPLPQGEVEG